MKKFFSLAILTLALVLVFPAFSFAQGMMGNDVMDGDNTTVQNDDGHTAREEAEGKAVWEKLQTKELKCEDLSDDDFGALGEYFMGQMMGDSHESMNSMMEQRIGEEREKQMHIAMGKRMSGCEPNAPMPQNMMSGAMMQMMMGGDIIGGFGNSMMGNFGFGWIFMILFWGLIILGIIALIKWITNQGGGKTQGKSALDILKERYASGKINKKEFEEKKKNLT